MILLRMLLSLGVLGLFGSIAGADISYQYIAVKAGDPAGKSYKAKPGTKLTFDVYLEETTSDKSITFLAAPSPQGGATIKIGLGSGAFRVVRATGDAAISSLKPNRIVFGDGGFTAGFPGLAGAPKLPVTTATINPTLTINPVGAVQGAQPLKFDAKHWRVKLATMEVTVGTEDSTFTISSQGNADSKTKTYTDLTGGVTAKDRISLDVSRETATADAPAFIGAFNNPYTLTIEVAK